MHLKVSEDSSHSYNHLLQAADDLGRSSAQAGGVALTATAPEQSLETAPGPLDSLAASPAAEGMDCTQSVAR